MSDGLAARVEALEAEVKRLKDLVEATKIEDVGGDLSIAFNCPVVTGVSVFVGDVEGDVSTGITSAVNGLTLNAGDIDGDFWIGVQGPLSGSTINTGDVSGDMCCGECECEREE